MRGRRLARVLARALALLLLAGASPANAREPAADSPKIVFDQQSRWNRVLVVDQGERRYLRFHDLSGDDQSEILRDDPSAVVMEYIRFAAAGLAVPPRLRRALIVGLGGGLYPMLLHRVRPSAKIEVVELDPLILDVAKRYFGFKEDTRLRVRIGDGSAAFRDGRSWDLILLDAYGADSIPEALATPAFFREVSRALSPGGVAVANIANSDPVAEKRTIADFAAAFSECILVHTPEFDNVIALGAAALPSDLASVLSALDREGRLPFAVAPIATMFKPCAAPR